MVTTLFLKELISLEFSIFLLLLEQCFPSHLHILPPAGPNGWVKISEFCSALCDRLEIQQPLY